MSVSHGRGCLLSVRWQPCERVGECIGGSRGGREGRTPPPGRPNSFDFMQFSGKFGVFTPPLEGSRPPLGKILDPPLEWDLVFWVQVFWGCQTAHWYSVVNLAFTFTFKLSGCPVLPDLFVGYCLFYCHARKFCVPRNGLSAIRRYHYRPQRSWAKVIFLHLSEILLTGGWVSQHALQVRSVPGGGIPACLAGWSRGSGPGGVWVRGVKGGPPIYFFWNFFLSSTFFGHTPPPPPPPEAESSIWSMSGRYASYWNAFLLLLVLICWTALKWFPFIHVAAHTSLLTSHLGGGVPMFHPFWRLVGSSMFHGTRVLMFHSTLGMGLLAHQYVGTAVSSTTACISISLEWGIKGSCAVTVWGH